MTLDSSEEPKRLKEKEHRRRLNGLGIVLYRSSAAFSIPPSYCRFVIIFSGLLSLRLPRDDHYGS